MICFVSTVAWPLKIYLEPHLNIIQNKTTSNILLIANDINKYGKENFNSSFLFSSVPIVRKVNLFYDFIAVFSLFFLLKKYKIKVLHSIMPKAGLVSMLAGYLAGVPLRIHTFTGQVWVTKRGLYYHFLKFIDTLIAKLATHVLCDSHLQREFLISNGIVGYDKIKVLGNGSISGIDCNRFSPNSEMRKEIRRKLNININDIVFLFVGRLNKDKGIFDLLRSFERVFETHKNTHLIIVGPDEENLDVLIEQLRHPCKKSIHRIDFSNTPENYMASCDVFCLPSYREGFNNSVLESGSVGIPVLASDIIGISDAVIDNETGILHNPGDVNAIYSGMIELATNSDLRFRLGQAARRRVVTSFSQKLVTDEFLKYYKKIGALSCNI